ncbi:MAG: DUF4159 domain-containing protein [Verrucomicrobia bacterium]|nr:DUF4159 domain-containing protein [Verrucomicrobiota bacterium]
MRPILTRPLNLSWLALLLMALCLTPPQVSAQRNARDMVPDGMEMPQWTVDPEFLYDAFAFVRVRYEVDGFFGRGTGGRYERWLTDAPDSEINFGWRLQQMTSMLVHPDGVFLDLLDPRIYNYPFLYIVEPGRLHLSDEEATALKAYLNNGGFLMFDDFWGSRDRRNVEGELKRLFPEKQVQELSLDHPIFHSVFPLKELPQVPNVETGTLSQYTGITTERGAGPPFYGALYDDKGRMMVILCHNTDNGDGWEREGENEYYFREFSEKKAYPMGINILFYVMTH